MMAMTLKLVIKRALKIFPLLQFHKENGFVHVVNNIYFILALHLSTSFYGTIMVEVHTYYFYFKKKIVL